MTPIPLQNRSFMKWWDGLLEPAVQKQELINGLIGWFDDGPHDVKSAVASLFAATQHAGVFYADGL